MEILNPNKFKIDIKNYKIVSDIQRGGFGSVFKVRDQATETEYAAKIIINSGFDDQSKKMINREIGIMMRVHHPAVIKFLGYSLVDFNGNNNVTIIMQLAENGSLAELISRCQTGNAPHSYDNTTRQKILIGIARGMMYLHQHHIIHRDLKPGNILLDSEFNPLITDFGLSKIYDSGNSSSQSQSYGTSVYMAPEVITGNNYNGKADVYSFGILMFEVVTDQAPYPNLPKKNLNMFEFGQKVVYENLRPTFSFEIKPSLKKLIERCWSKDPNERPTFEEIFNKLSFSIENSIYDICDCSEEPDKFYLDDVDQGEVVNYAYFLVDSEDDRQLNSDAIEKLTNKLALFQIQMQDVIEENRQMKKQINEVILKEIVHLRKENDELKESNTKLAKMVDDLVKNKTVIVMDLDEDAEDETRPMNFDGQRSEKVPEGPQKVQDHSEKVYDHSEKVHDHSEKVEPNSKEGQLTIGEFDMLPLKEQLLFISNIVQEQKSWIKSFQKSFSSIFKTANPLFIGINNILTYLMKYNPHPQEDVHYFNIATRRLDEPIESMRIDEIAQSHFLIILSDGIEALYKGNALNSKDFISMLRQFDKSISIEMKYPSENFLSIFTAVLQIKEKSLPYMRITVLITGVSKTDDNFKDNKEIQYVKLRNVKEIGSNSFLDCSNLIQAVIPNSVTLIGSSSFCGCSSMTFLGIPDSVKTIEKSAFEYCSSLKYAEIPSSVEKIGSSAFEACSSLKAVKLPSLLNSIEESTFCMCSSLRTIEIPPSVVSIGPTAFCECTSLKVVKCPQTVKSIGTRCFYRCSSIETFSIPESVESIEIGTFEGCLSLKKITVPDSVVSIGSNAFKDCNSLEQVNLPPNVTVVQKETFMNCSSLKVVSTPSLLNSIEESAFSGCSSLEQINLPTAMSRIGKNAFNGCSAMKSVFIPNSITSIGINAFNNCSALAQIYIPNDLPTENLGIGPKTKIAKII